MLIKFNKYEKIAGIFVLVAIVGALLFSFGLLIKLGWFAPKVYFRAVFSNAAGVFPGTTVQINGLNAGAVTSVDLKEDNDISVKFYIARKFHNLVKSDSKVIVTRPFIIGDRILDISPGSKNLPILEDKSLIPSENSVDIMDILNGKKIAPYLNILVGVMENLKVVAEAFLDINRTKSFIKIFDKLEPWIDNMNKASEGFIQMSNNVNYQGNIKKVFKNLVKVTSEINKILPSISKNSPHLANDFNNMTKNIIVLSEELKTIIPALREIAPDLPNSSRRAIEALDEVVITLKAMQKSFLLRGSVKKVKEEEINRLPATP